MKKNSVVILAALLGIPFFALGQYGTRDDGFGNRIPLGPPNTQQQRPVLQPYYPRTNVVPSPRPAQTSISPAQSPAAGIVGRKPILYSGPGCGICQQMMADFARNNPGKDINDYFEVIDDRSKFQPSIEGGPIGKEGVASAMAAAVAAGPVRTAPIPTGKQPIELVQEKNNGVPTGRYYFSGAYGYAFLPKYDPDEVFTVTPDGKKWLFKDAMREYFAGRLPLSFTGIYDPVTGKLGSTFVSLAKPPSTTDPKIVPDPRDIPPASTGSGFYIKPRPVKDPATMTSEELKAAKAVQDKKNADMKARIDEANKKLDEILKQNSKNP